MEGAGETGIREGHVTLNSRVCVLSIPEFKCLEGGIPGHLDYRVRDLCTKRLLDWVEERAMFNIEGRKKRYILLRF